MKPCANCINFYINLFSGTTNTIAICLWNLFHKWYNVTQLRIMYIDTLILTKINIENVDVFADLLSTSINS